MVSFSCEACGDVLTKKKLDPHRNRCRGATFTCIDCMVYFPGLQYRSHTSCMTEDQKYQGALYKGKPKKNNSNLNNNNHAAKNNTNNNMAHHAYVEDFRDDGEWADYEEPTDDEKSPAALPEAPTPPAAVADDNVDVFAFMVASGQTPNASKVNLTADAEPEAPQSTSLVRYEHKADDYLDATAFLDEEQLLVEYGSGPVPTGEFVTPAPKSERRKSGDKKDKKRKRLHVDVPGDQEMTDAPPVLHSGLTGGLNRMMKPVFPPSPDYSGGDAPETTPLSPMKKSKHSKHSKHSKSSQSSSLFGKIAGSKSKTKAKTKKRKTSSKKSSSSSSSSSKDKSNQLIQYRPKDNNGEVDASQVILYKPRADVFLSFVDKGPESERGLSMNKVLKRFHRERQASGAEVGKGSEEKELWKSLRLRQNEQGEIVLFSV